MRLAGNENESAIGNGATRRYDKGGATRSSWVRGPIVGLWVCRSWVVGLLFVGSWVCRSWVCGFAVRGFAVRGFNDLRLTISPVVQRSQLSRFTISLSLSLFARESLLSLFLSLRVFGNDLK